MATRPAFFIKDGKVSSQNVPFEWSGGFAISQKRKNITKVHAALSDGNALEISTKGTELFGQRLSAFNLKLNGHPIENVFQSSKAFENGGPYMDLLYVSPKDAKQDIRLKTSGKLVNFNYGGMIWPLDPKTCFYDYMYIKAVRQSFSLEELLNLRNYKYFTDIEFNPSKSINTQARSVAIVKLFMEMYGFIPEMSENDFIRFHKKYVDI